MVKITKEGYTPILESGTTEKVIGQAESAANQGSGLVDSILRNVDATGRQASSDRMRANEDALQQKIGLSEGYFKTQQKYLNTVRQLTEIDEINESRVADQLASAYNLQAGEKIKLATAQFYENEKQKNPLGLVENVSGFINQQIEEAVKTAPNDKAVQTLYAQMSAFKVDKIGSAIKDKAEARKNQIDGAIGDTQKTLSANIRLNPNPQLFQESLQTFNVTADILKEAGFADDQIGQIKESFNKELTKSLVKGFLDKGDTDSVKQLFSDVEVVKTLGKDFDSLLNESKSLAKERLTEQVKDEARILASNLYNTGKSPSGVDGFEDVVADENLAFFQQSESSNDPADASTVNYQYFKRRNSFIPARTTNYMINSIAYGNDGNKAALYAGTISKMLKDADTAPLLSKVSSDQLIPVSSMIYHLQSGKSPQEALEITRGVMQKRLDSGKSTEQFNTEINAVITDKVGSLDNLEIGKGLWRDLEKSSNGYMFSKSIVGRLLGSRPEDSGLRELGKEYSSIFRETYNRTQDSELADFTAKNHIKKTASLTNVNGLWQAMPYNPDKLGLRQTEDQKQYFNETLTKAKTALAELQGGKLDEKGRIVIGQQQREVDLAPIPFRTGFEENGVVTYMLINREDGLPYYNNGQIATVAFNTNKTVEKKRQQDEERFKSIQELYDKEGKVWDTLQERFNKKQNTGVEVGK